jgi:hypothetical protein
VGLRGLQWPAPHVKENLGRWGREGHKKEEKPCHCASHGKEMQKTQKWQIHSRSCTPTAGNAVETRECNGAVHQIYLVLNYLITEVTLFFLEC